MSDVLRRKILANVHLTQNELTMTREHHFREEVDFTESMHMRVTLATNMSSPQEIDLTGGDSVTFAGSCLMVETDRTVDVGVDTSSNLINVGNAGVFLLTGSFSHVYVQNNSTTYVANIEVVATD